MARKPVCKPLLHLLFLLLLTSNSGAQSTAATQPNAGKVDVLRTVVRDWGNPAALNSWSTGNWTGVTCNSDGQVTALSFMAFHIAKPIPASICRLKNLSAIKLSYNNLTGEFPTVLYSCMALQLLDLSNNQFTGSLPGHIDKLSSEMEHLNLSSNGFIGDVPSAIGRFLKLKSLVLDTNRFNGSYPAASIGGLVELEMLTLASNQFVPGPIPDEFGKLTKLKTLWLSGMNLTGCIPDSLSALTELKLLDMSQNNLQGTIPEWIWKLQKLERLYLYINNFTGGIAPAVTAVSMLEVDLSMNSLTAPIPESIGNMKKLNLLFLYYNKIIGRIPVSLGLLPNLTNVRLFDNRLSGPLPPELGMHSPLGNLEVSNNLLSGELPDTLCYNKKLYGIVVFNNSFAGVFPAILGECDTLDYIMAYNNRFVGDFPAKIWSFSKLTTIQIYNNDFTGTLPDEISPNISRIEMEYNRFSGAIPTSAAGLNVFSAQNNLFSGALPPDMTGLANLNHLNLAGNRISGSIPSSVLLLRRLNFLNLSSNQISGEIPPAIGLLEVLNVLDLSNNALTGRVPPEFGKLHLSALNLSVNDLSGEVPPLLQSPAYDRSFLGNRRLCANVDKYMNLRVCRYGGRSMTGLIIVFSVLCVVLACAVAIGCLIIRRQKHQEDLTVWTMTPFRTVDFSECDIITNLSEEKENMIGSGGFSKVYRVHLRGKSGTNMVVAVKKMWSAEKSDAELEKGFVSEVKSLGKIRHNNIVSLHCCISGDATKLLVYDYMENGNLDLWLHHWERTGAVAPLNWPTRLAIAIDVARGLSYMHASHLIHRDIKCSNILLDRNFRAKIGDFGFARTVAKSDEPEIASVVCGTFGYISPDYFNSKMVSKKADVYSFGVVLLELATGRGPKDGGTISGHNLAKWASRKNGPVAIDHEILKPACRDDMVAVFELGVACTSENPFSRPTMSEILRQLLWRARNSIVPPIIPVN